MHAEFALNPFPGMMPTEEDQKNYIDARETFKVYNEFTDTALKLIEETEEDLTDSKYAGEGLIGSIGEFIGVIFRTVKRFVEDTASWLSKKIKSVISFRKRQKKLRDAKFTQLSQLWASLPADRKAEAQRRFAGFNLNNTPSFDGYKTMCQDFSLLIGAVDLATRMYISQDVAIFGQQRNDNKSVPNWITELYEKEPSRLALISFGIRFEEERFTYQSPFLSMPSMSIGDLGYVGIEAISVINESYQTNCWRKLPTIVSLRETFERFERQVDDKERELKKNVDKCTKKDLASSCKLVALSVSMAGKLTAYITQVEEALDTRRGWLIDAGLRACLSGGESETA